MNPFEILEIKPGASADEVKAAYHRLAKQWHPDRFSGDAKIEAENKFRQLSEAFAMLRDMGRRGETSSPPPSPAPSPSPSVQPQTEKVAKDPKAKTSEDWFQDAKASMEHGDMERALGLAQYAIRLDPKKAEYHLFLANALETTKGDRRLVVKALETAIALDPKDVEAMIRLAEVFRSLGMTARAEGLLDRARLIAPQHKALKVPRNQHHVVKTTEKLGLGDQLSSLLTRISASFGRNSKRS